MKIAAIKESTRHYITINYHFILTKQEGWLPLLSERKHFITGDPRAENFTHEDANILLEILHGYRLIVENIVRTPHARWENEFYISDFIWGEFNTRKNLIRHEEGYVSPLEIIIEDENTLPVNPVFYITDTFPEIVSLEDLEDLIRMSRSVLTDIRRGKYHTIGKTYGKRFSQLIRKPPEVICAEYRKWVATTTPKEKTRQYKENLERISYSMLGYGHPRKKPFRGYHIQRVSTPQHLLYETQERYGTKPLECWEPTPES